MFNYCFEHNLPLKVEALLYYLGADSDTVKDWDIDYDGDYSITINDIEYEIYDEDEAQRILYYWCKDYAEEVVYEAIPAYLLPYFDMERYIKDIVDEEEISAAIDGATEIYYKSSIFYYVEL